MPCVLLIASCQTGPWVPVIWHLCNLKAPEDLGVILGILEVNCSLKYTIMIYIYIERSDSVLNLGIHRVCFGF
jgi:hypothetical protein